MDITHPIPVPILRQLLRLDPETGRLYWLPRGPEWFAEGNRGSNSNAARWNDRYAGCEALTAVQSGARYRHGKILGRLYLAHRVVFALFHGRWPTDQVDHINGVRSDNRPSNLRDASQSENMKNVGSRRGTSRFKGVYWIPKIKKWGAQCQSADGNRLYLGVFTDETEAALACDRVARVEHGEFARLNFPDS